MRRSSNRERGVTFVEIIIVVVVIMVVSAIVMPDILNSLYGVRLRSSVNSVAGLMQAARMRAVNENKTYFVHSAVFDQATIMWADDQATSTAPAAKNPQASLSGSVQLVTSGNPGNPTLDFNPIRDSLPIFNSHGMPCAMNGTSCLNWTGSGSVGYQLYLTDSRGVGSNGWATVVVAPGGRMQRWMYNGGAWGN